MSVFNNPFQQSPGISYKYLYQRNKILVWILGISLLALIFLKADFFDIFWPLYLSVFSAYILRNYFTELNIAKTYILGYLAGLALFAVFFDLTNNWQQAIAVAFGSAAYALLTRMITYTPNLQVKMLFIGVIKIVWVGIFLIAIDLLTINPTYLNPRLVHIGGMFYGFLSIYLLKNKIFRLSKIADYFKKSGKSKNAPKRPLTDEEYNKKKKENMDEIDRILEKVKHRGYDFLSAEEKRKLFEKSKN